MNMVPPEEQQLLDALLMLSQEEVWSTSKFSSKYLTNAYMCKKSDVFMIITRSLLWTVLIILKYKEELPKVMIAKKWNWKDNLITKKLKIPLK